MSQQKTILIVDDDTDLREALAEQLALEADFKVTEAGTVAQGLAAARSLSPDLIILDVDLPDGDGRDACKQLRSEGISAPVIMLTAAAEDADAIRGLDSGADDYVIKPFKFAVLAARIRAHLRAHEQSEHAVFHIGPYEFRPAQKVLIDLLVKLPADIESRVELGDLYVASGQEAKAEAEYARVRGLAPKLPIGYVKSGALYLKQGNKARARAEYEKAYALNQRSWLVANDLAFLIAESSSSPGDLDRALGIAEKARTLNPEAFNVLDTLGWLHYKKGEAPKAVELLRQVQSKKPEVPEVNFHLGMALFQAGKLQEAKQMLNKALSGTGAFAGRDEATRTLAKI